MGIGSNTSGAGAAFHGVSTGTGHGVWVSNGRKPAQIIVDGRVVCEVTGKDGLVVTGSDMRVTFNVDGLRIERVSDGLVILELR